MAVINLKSQTDLSGFYIVYKGSVQNEKPGNFGISHLMEHLVYKSIDYLMDDFDRYGISNNAYTSDTEIVFHITGLDEHINKYKNIILEKLLKFQITEEQFINERQIVLQEYEMYFGQRTDNHALNLNRKLFNTYDAIGSRQDLESLTYQDIKDYFELQFSKPHTIINVSKHNDFKTDIEFSTIEFDNIIEFNETDSPETIYEPINLTPGKVSLININKNIITKDFPYISFITRMLGHGLKSPLYQEIREKKGLVYYIRCSLDRMTDNSGILQFSSETSDNNIEEFQNTLKEILDNPDKYMTKERFEIIYDAVKASLKTSNINRYNNVSKYITPKEWQVEYILVDLTFEKIMNYYDKYFNFDDLYLSIDSQENFNK
jgi:predicted Zn-dependent peptidase